MRRAACSGLPWRQRHAGGNGASQTLPARLDLPAPCTQQSKPQWRCAARPSACVPCEAGGRQLVAEMFRQPAQPPAGSTCCCWWLLLAAATHCRMGLTRPHQPASQPQLPQARTARRRPSSARRGGRSRRRRRVGSQSPGAGPHPGSGAGEGAGRGWMETAGLWSRQGGRAGMRHVQAAAGEQAHAVGLIILFAGAGSEPGNSAPFACCSTAAVTPRAAQQSTHIAAPLRRLCAPPPPHLDGCRHERPALAADVPFLAARAHIVIVGQINIKHQLALHGGKALAGACSSVWKRLHASASGSCQPLKWACDSIGFSPW